MICKHGSVIDLCHSCQYDEGRNDGLEEAAKVAEKHHFECANKPQPRVCVCENAIGDAIRALKDKP